MDENWGLKQDLAHLQRELENAAGIPGVPTGKSLLFFRDYHGFTGGHLKHWNYFTHTLVSEDFTPYIYFTPQSLWDSNNPWNAKGCDSLIKSRPLRGPDAIFLEGVSDWPLLDQFGLEALGVPIINLIQHIRHADPDDPRYRYLNRKAIRICVSSEVKQAIEATGQVNGPVFAINNGLDMSDMPPPLDIDRKEHKLLIVAQKEPELGRQLAAHLSDNNVPFHLMTEMQPRREFLRLINQVQITVFLPNKTELEGFYLPALEGMSLNSVVICPDVVGNRSFCLNGKNCFMPGYEFNAIILSINEALAQNSACRGAMIKEGRLTVEENTLAAERRKYLRLLGDIDQIWMRA